MRSTQRPFPLTDLPAMTSLRSSQRIRRHVHQLTQEVMRRGLRNNCQRPDLRVLRPQIPVQLGLRQLTDLHVRILKSEEPRRGGETLLSLILRHPPDDVLTEERLIMLRDLQLEGGHVDL